MTLRPDDFDDLLTSDIIEPAIAADNAAVAAELAAQGFAVFPHRDWNDGDGPKPIAGFLTKASADERTVAEWWRQWPDARVGLVTGERNGVSVLDVDRKKGKDGVATLADLGFFDIAALSPFRVLTPSGGWHLYFRFDPRLKNWVDKIGKGLDVRTTGGFVMAPGSFKDDARYRVVTGPLNVTTLPDFPETLIPPAEPERSTATLETDASQEQRDWAREKLCALADKLSGTKEGNRNFTLNTAAMWAGGAAAHGFLDRDDALDILLNAAVACGLKKRASSATIDSGWKAGLLKPIAEYPRRTARDEFDDVEELPAALTRDSLDEEAENPVTRRLNRRHAVVVTGGRTVVTTEGRDGSIAFGTVRDIHAFYENDQVTVAKGKTEPASKRWMRDPERRTFRDGVTFAPGGCSPTMLNLWRGWAVEPDPAASCERFLNHVRHVVCNGDPEQSTYLLGWLAHMVQRPDEKPGVALVLRGAKGAGKDTVADYVSRMIGRRHAPTVAESSHIVGKFNARLENALLLHVQEGSWAGDRRAEGVLKYLVTSDRIEIERKGIDSINLPSVLRMFISANADWVVPASADERRWAVFEVSDRRRGNEAYFTALRTEMNGNGPAALLHYLQNYDLTGFNVRKAPETEGLRNQKIASLRNIDLWWFEMLNHGMLSDFEDGDGWSASVQLVGRGELRQRYLEWMRGRRFDGEAVEERHFGRRMRDMLPDLQDRRPSAKPGVTRVRQYEVPALADCRAAFDQWLGQPVDWDAGE